MFMSNIAAAFACIMVLAPSALGATIPNKRQSDEEMVEARLLDIEVFFGKASTPGCNSDLSQSWSYEGDDAYYPTESYYEADCWSSSTEEMADGRYADANETINSFQYSGVQTKIYFYSGNSCLEENMLGNIVTGNHTAPACYDTKAVVQNKLGKGIRKGWQSMKAVLVEE